MTTPAIKFTSKKLADITKGDVEAHIESLGDTDPKGLYRQVMDTVELPILKAIMKHTRGNQSRAANCLGVNRATLSSKLKRQGLKK